MKIIWQWKPFNELTAQEIYRILKLRMAVFVVEQNEIYQDADGKDLFSWHLCGYSPTQELIAYARLILPSEKSKPLHFGRVIVKPAYRGKGLARALIKQILDKIQQSEFKNYSIEISAQAHLDKFYASFGFQPIGEHYYDGTILHITMIKNAA